MPIRDPEFITDAVTSRMQLDRHLPPVDVGEITAIIRETSTAAVAGGGCKGSLPAISRRIARELWLELFASRDEPVLIAACEDGFFEGMDTETLKTLAVQFAKDRNLALEIAVRKIIAMRSTDDIGGGRKRYLNLKYLSIACTKFGDMDGVLYASEQLLALIKDFADSGVTSGSLDLRRVGVLADKFYAQHQVYKHSSLPKNQEGREQRKDFYKSGTFPKAPVRVRRTSHGVLRDMAIEDGDYKGALENSHIRIGLLWPTQFVTDPIRDNKDIQIYLNLASMEENADNPILPKNPLCVYRTNKLQLILQSIPLSDGPFVRCFLLEDLANRGLTTNKQMAIKYLKMLAAETACLGQYVKSLDTLQRLLFLGETINDEGTINYAASKILSLKNSTDLNVSDACIENVSKHVVFTSLLIDPKIRLMAYCELFDLYERTGKHDEAQGVLRVWANDTNLPDKTGLVERLVAAKI